MSQDVKPYLEKQCKTANPETMEEFLQLLARVEQLAKTLGVNLIELLESK